MTTITRRKAMTVDALRERLRKAMAKSHERDCVACGGSGRVSGPLTTVDVVDGAGITQSAVYAFLAKNKGLSLEAGLKLLVYLDELERSPLDELDDEHEPQSIEARERESERRRQLGQASAAAAAKAGVDAMNRPLVTRS